MKRTSAIITVFFVLAAVMLVSQPSAGQAPADEVSIAVSLNRDTIGLDEQALLTVQIAGPTQNLPKPDLPPMVRFEVYSQGQSSNISIVNGQVSSTVTYRYLLVPTKAGTYPISNISVVYNNRRYKGETVELTVLDKGTATTPELEDQATGTSGAGRDYFLEAVVDNENPYVNEQVTLTLKFYIAVQHYGSPELIEPSTTGFWNELLGNKAPYRQKINGRIYKAIERKYALFPTQTGELTIGQAAIRVTVADRNRRTRDPFGAFSDFFSSGKEVTVRSKPVTINVKPLPTAGRPKDFTGAIGRYSITARADKQRVDVNQPVTVTIRISGTGNIKAAAEPPIPELDDFRIYESSSSENVTRSNDQLSGTKTYEEVFIPRRPGQLTIPAIEYSYFDPKQGRYLTTSTHPIPITALKPEGYTGTTDLPYAGSEMVVGSSARDIRFIKNNVGDTVPQGGVILFSPVYLIVNGLPLVVLLGMIVVRVRRERLQANVGYARSIQAGKKARKRLATARSLATIEQGSDFYAELHLTLTSYIADKLNVSPYGLTTDSIKELLESRGAGEDLVANINEILQECDFARFAPASITQDDIDAALKKVEDIMIRLEAVRFA